MKANPDVGLDRDGLRLDETAAAIASGGDKPRGRLRISAPLLFSQIAMGKLVAEFALKYPEVRLDVTTEDRAARRRRACRAVSSQSS